MTFSKDELMLWWKLSDFFDIIKTVAMFYNFRGLIS